MAETTTVRAWRSVLERIEADLLDGSLAPGDRLPGERELAASLGVGRRAAYLGLQRGGGILLRVRQRVRTRCEPAWGRPLGCADSMGCFAYPP